MTIDIEKETYMDREPIYPLPEYDPGDEVPRTVNQRLAPIFRALADDPDGWRTEWCAKDGDGWLPRSNFPVLHDGCNHFRLVRKKPKTITVTIPVPKGLSSAAPGRVCALVYTNESDCREAEKSIRKAMEGK